MLLAMMLVTVARARTGPTTLPPVWFTFLLVWCTAVAGWSERELRVEAFSLPLGLALLLLVLATGDERRSRRLGVAAQLRDLTQRVRSTVLGNPRTDDVIREGR